jgi:hypothetical protein
MTFESDYQFMDKMLKMFRLDDNAVKTVQHKQQRTASIANNIQPEQDQLCANMISEVIKVAAERVSNNNKSKQSRTASVAPSTKIDEVGLLKSFMMKAYPQ